MSLLKDWRLRAWLSLCLVLTLLMPVSGYAAEGKGTDEPASLITGAGAADSFEQIYQTDGIILDYDGLQALVYQPLDQTISISAIDGSASEIIANGITARPDKAQLTEEGALFHLPGVSGESKEFRNGVLQTLQAYSWVSKGPYLVYYDSSGDDGSLDSPGTNGLRLRHGNQIESIVNPQNHYYPLGGYDVSEDGTVAYSFVGQLFRYKDGQSQPLTEPLTQPDLNDQDNSEVKVDGTSIMFTSYNPDPAVKLLAGVQLVTLAGPYDDYLYYYQETLRNTGFAIAEGWSVYPKMDESGRYSTLWLRSPEWIETSIVSEPGTNRVIAVSPSGEVVYGQVEDGATRYELNRLNPSTGERESVEVPSGRAKWIDGGWRFLTDSVVYQLGAGQENPESLLVDPGNLDLQTGDESQLTVTAQYAGGQTKDVTQTAIYTTSNAAVVSVSDNGAVLALASGTAVITVTYGGQQSSVQVTIENQPPTVQSLRFSPASLNMTAGNAEPFTVFALYSDDTQRDVTMDSEFSSSDSSVAAVAANKSSIDAIAAGSTVITAVYGGKSADLQVRVEPEADIVKELALLIKNEKMKVGKSRQLVVYAFHSSGEWGEVTSSAEYASSNPSVVTVKAGGKLTAKSRGTAIITVTYGGVERSLTITVKR
ncbi:Ig-like domain-containing protein [Paenibacillus nasutitermitis]|uniref:BIG2 domain-containing protein n=1 Tax=Paenibacillus nasutitermitis TaxID=1652958 RepID=A0A916YTM7_9BACL|nr:Ig-like domain-containing protein [Paenibacillus nasutitermitis]GGD60011.1 hypothetical protein GCM10010911_17350 [Paenibacillus nasutitermitis]